MISFSGDFIGLALRSQIRGNGDLGQLGAICFDSRLGKEMTMLSVYIIFINILMLWNE